MSAMVGSMIMAMLMMMLLLVAMLDDGGWVIYDA